ncbi:hypothetical protein OEZ85_013658 [Tetradesmus obliquus]|uniref:SET domain-containing protein n=1 Tax=Tetradesmus obliquus TaxID=3088 RepID=A0ABY8URS3_TETOB|nr:hypothetical protein OEZ85_013658 [Tetradesmus obliquus]
MLFWVVCMLALAWPHAVSAAAKPAAAAAYQQPSADGLPGVHNKASDALLRWVRSNGGQVHVAVRVVPGRGRGTFAAWDLEPGDVLASIPVELVYAANYSLGAGFESAGPMLVLDMADPSSFWQPYFSSLPKPGQVLSKELMPQSYSPIIQDENTEAAIRLLQDNIEQYCRLLQPAFDKLQMEANVTRCAHGTALLSTRTFSYNSQEVLLPIVDLANHDNACLHTHRVEPCDVEAGNKQREEGLPAPEIPPSFASGAVTPAETEDTEAAAACSDKGGQHVAGSCKGDLYSKQSRGASGICIVWRAETAVAKGGELCNNYGLLLQDNTVLQYGFLQAGDIALELSMLDRPEHSQKFEEVWDKPKSTWGQPLPHKFTGTAQDIQAEVQRLSERLQALRAGDAAVAGIKVHSDDPGGKMLPMLLEWRQQRLHAIKLELQRLADLREDLRLDAIDEL